MKKNLSIFAAVLLALGIPTGLYLHKSGLYYIGAIFSVTVVTSVVDSPSNPVTARVRLDQRIEAIDSAR